jgi:hypothetical protein
MTDSNMQRAEQDSLAPIQLDRLTIEEEVAFMNRGKKPQLLLAVALIALAGVGGDALIKQMNRDLQYTQAGQAVSDAQAEQVQAYLQCALPGTHPASVTSTDELHGAIENLVERFHEDYSHLLKRCEPKLQALLPALARVSAPAPLEPELRALRASAKELTTSALALRTYVAREGASDDFVQTTAHIHRFAEAKAAYDAHDSSFARALEAAR